MQIVHSLDPLRSAVETLRRDGALALVPTMGALHEGHLTLVREARRHARSVAVSIFVNPRQFGAGEDLDAYPRQFERDCALLAGEGVELVWAPAVSAMYPDGYATNISVSGVTRGCAAAAGPDISMAWRPWCASCSIRSARMSRCSAKKTGSSSP